MDGRAPRTLVVDRPDGARLEVQVDDDLGPRRPPLLLLAGQAGSHAWWTDLRRRFSPRFRTVTLDQRGTGATSAPAGDLSTTLLADDAVAVLDALGVDRVHVYGTSMGGRVAQVLAATHGDRVASTVLAATAPGGPHAVAPSPDVVRMLVDPGPAARLAALVRLFYTPDWGDDPARSRLLGDPTMTAGNRRRHVRMSARHDAWDLLPDIASPVLVLHGAQDRLTPVANAELLAARLPDARLHVHAVGRHGFFDEFAADLEPVLDGFWSSVGPG